MRLRSDVFYSDPGERMKQEYTAVVLGDGTINLVESEKTDLQEYINSFRDSVSIEHIMAMCAAGDTSALNRVQGSYIDCSKMPKTFREVLDIVIDGRAKFDQLPLNIKQKFGNDFNAWFSDVGSPDWFEKMEFIEQVKAADQKEQVSTNAES